MILHASIEFDWNNLKNYDGHNPVPPQIYYEHGATTAMSVMIGVLLYFFF